MSIKGYQVEVIPLSQLASHNGIDLEELKGEIQFNGNMCNLSEIESDWGDDLDADGREEDVLVDLWS